MPLQCPHILGKATAWFFFEQGHFVRQLRASNLHLRHSPKLECGPPCLSLNVLVLVQVVVAMAWVHKAAAWAPDAVPPSDC